MVIVVQCKGGVGNQMFQYALGRRLADIRGDKLFLDSSYYQNTPNRHISIDKFNIRVDEPTEEDRHLPYTIIQEKGLQYHPDILTTKEENIVLQGYWQNPDYFFGYKEQLRKDFTLKVDINDIKESNSVAAHMRGEDYRGWKKFDVVTSDYYRRAFALIDLAVEKPQFFIFSNDPEYAHYLLREVDNKYSIHYVSREDYIDFDIMKKCSHYIIANSSFSWWGSFLGENLNKIVIAPRLWFNDDGQTNEHNEISLHREDMTVIEP